eukprot:CAMPEP_0183794362 /NCGR_PEP_ID=MMETSP0803_2-20130417/3794_1 /TAXON_ID=195967 /ORGANISM="Crustomastix stigmata, Strain CCMP3273" /LENGTH=290 /DNA_ID=CAMNT_0026038765 /DNA_START=60 /DNA_END=929 /DNA_ORIENTATION=-
MTAPRWAQLDPVQQAPLEQCPQALCVDDCHEGVEHPLVRHAGHHPSPHNLEGERRRGRRHPRDGAEHEGPALGHPVLARGSLVCGPEPVVHAQVHPGVGYDAHHARGYAPEEPLHTLPREDLAHGVEHAVVLRTHGEAGTQGLEREAQHRARDACRRARQRHPPPLQVPSLVCGLSQELLVGVEGGELEALLRYDPHDVRQVPSKEAQGPTFRPRLREGRSEARAGDHHLHPDALQRRGRGLAHCTADAASQQVAHSRRQAPDLRPDRSRLKARLLALRLPRRLPTLIRL